MAEGDVLVRLDDTLQRLQLEMATARLSSDVDIRAAEARLQSLDRTLERVTELESRNAVPATALEEAQTEVDLARLALERALAARAQAEIEQSQAQALLDRRTILSPVDGVVTEVAAAGEFATEQARLLSIAEMDPLHVEAFVPADYFGRLAVGEEYEVTQAAPLEGLYSATLKAIDQVFDAASGTFGNQLHIANPEGTIPAGFRCAVDLDVPTLD